MESRGAEGFYELSASRVNTFAFPSLVAAISVTRFRTNKMLSKPRGTVLVLPEFSI